MIKVYKIIKIGRTKEDTEIMLNELEKDGYRVVCSYALLNLHLILHKENAGV